MTRTVSLTHASGIGQVHTCTAYHIWRARCFAELFFIEHSIFIYYTFITLFFNYPKSWTKSHTNIKKNIVPQRPPLRIFFSWLSSYCHACSHQIRHVESYYHYNDVIMRAMASQITSLMIVYSTVYSGADQRKHQGSASLAFARGIHRWSVSSLEISYARMWI